MAAEKLETVSPLATLKRGYSITHSVSKKTVSSINDVEVGEVITTQVEDGGLNRKWPRKQQKRKQLICTQLESPIRFDRL